MKPVLLLIFNRPTTTQRVFDVIRYAQPSRLYIAADAPRPGNKSDEESCRLTRAVTDNIDWPCDVKRLYQTQNLGCSLGPRAAFTWFFSQEEEGIILEDDCVPHPDFFVFATEMLNRYRNNERIISINGSNLGYQLNNGYSYTYSRFMNMWGWATWKRSHEKIDYQLNHWKGIRNKTHHLWTILRINIFDFDFAWINYWIFQFDKTVNSSNLTWWDYQWIYYQLHNKKYSIVPSVNLVSNIGFSEDASHTFNINSPAFAIPTESMIFPITSPKKVKPDFNFETKYVKKIWCSYKKLFILKSIYHILKSCFK